MNIVRSDSYVGDDWHVWALEWTPDGMAFLFDGQVVWSVTTQDYPWLATAFTESGTNIRINTQVGHEWIGFTDPSRPDETVLPATYEIDYVRVWSLPQ